MKRPDTPLQAIWRSGRKGVRILQERYRGVILVACIPVLLILAVLLLVPRKSPLLYDQQLSIKQLRNHSAGFQYAVVFDAGSTGSRIHVFKFRTSSQAGTSELMHDTFEQLKPGLSAYADDPQKAADSLKPLLETALKTVPKELQAQTPLSLKATAGLRLLPGDKADKILEAVRALFKQQPFKLGDNAVSIMDGQDEGAFAWLTLNYLLERLGTGPEATVSAIDLGGGSVQEAFALSDDEAAAAPNGYIVKLKGGGSTYNVYVHSYLGYGLMAGRAKVMDALQATQGAHPCFSKGGDLKYTYAGREYIIKAGDAAANHQQCMATSTAAMNVSLACGLAVAQEQCGFNGAWRGKARQGSSYYVSSYFWDRALDSGIISDDRAITWETTPQAFADKASEVCSKTDVEAVQAAYKGVKPDAAPFFCLDLSFCHQLLTTGFKLNPTQHIKLVKQISYKGQNIEASWALGAAVNELSS